MEDKSAETKAPKSGQSAAPKSGSTEKAVEKAIHEFLDAHLRDSDFSRDTPAWNHFQAGIPVLIESITKAIKEG